jgi:outer membrane protein OmpA-like peptidoglycan-associated protein/Tol biopolymer transport system component
MGKCTKTQCLISIVSAISVWDSAGYLVRFTTQTSYFGVFYAPMRPNTFIFICYFLCAFSGYAQSEKKAARYFNEALALKAGRQYDDACRKMEQAIVNDPSAPDPYSILGQWYFEGHEFAKAAETFKSGSIKSNNGRFRFAKPLAKSLIYAGDGDEALQVINTFATIKDSADWNLLRRQATFVRTAMQKSWGIWPENLGIRVNTPDPELFPSMAVDTQFLYFTRRRNNMDEDLYYARADSCGGWFKGLNMGDPPNTSNQESAQFVSADGHYLFYTRCENRSENGWAEGGCDMFMAYRATLDTDWTIGQPFGQTINTTSYEGMPSLSPDNRELYFVSDRNGGMGGYDIWFSRFENGLWQLPVNAGPGINTPGNETTPYISADNHTLFFASDYWPGMGGTDIFMARRTAQQSWSPAVNMGYPINTAHDEKSQFVALDGKTFYFASDRNGPAGNYDLYQTVLPGIVAPAPVSYLQGYVFDSISRERLNSAAMLICNAATGDTLYELRSNRGDATYIITLQAGKSYAIHTSRMGYQSVSDTVLLGEEFVKRPMTHNVAMLTFDYNPLKPIDDSLIASIHYDVNVTELSAADKDALKAAIAPWLDVEEIVVYVNAYTDNTGTPMINESLSYKRANVVAQEVISAGFDKSVVTAKGWGEANAVAPNDTEEGRFKNRRVEIIVRR